MRFFIVFVFPCLSFCSKVVLSEEPRFEFDFGHDSTHNYGQTINAIFETSNPLYRSKVNQPDKLNNLEESINRVSNHERESSLFLTGSPEKIHDSMIKGESDSIATEPNTKSNPDLTRQLHHVDRKFNNDISIQSTTQSMWDQTTSKGLEIIEEDVEKVKNLVRQQVAEELVKIKHLQKQVYKKFHYLNGECLASSGGRNYFNVDTNSCEDCATCYEDICYSLCNAYYFSSSSQKNNSLREILTIFWILVGVALIAGIFIKFARPFIYKQIIVHHDRGCTDHKLLPKSVYDV